jgi:hypothetical protein
LGPFLFRSEPGIRFLDLMGSHPELAIYSEKLFFEPPEVYPDPLVVFPIEYALEEARNVTGEEDWGDKNQQGWRHQ